MPTHRFKLTKLTKGRIDQDKVNATTEADIQRYKAEDDADAAADAAAYARRKRAGITSARTMRRDQKGRFVSSRKTLRDNRKIAPSR
jgi:hypothetical protein